MYLTACMVPKVTPIHLEPTVVIHMHKLMHHSLFHVRLTKELACTQNHGAWVGTEATNMGQVTWGTQDVRCGDLASNLLQMLEHEYDSRTYANSFDSEYL